MTKAKSLKAATKAPAKKKAAETVSAVGVLLMSEIQAIWHFYAVMMVVAIGSSAAGPGQWCRAKRRGSQ